MPYSSIQEDHGHAIVQVEHDYLKTVKGPLNLTKASFCMHKG